MAKQNNLGDILKKRNPLEERQIITPVDVLETERTNRTDEPNESTERMNRTSERLQRTNEPNESSELSNRTDERSDRMSKPNVRAEHNKRTDEPNARTERMNRTVFEELKEETAEDMRRPTERYSFEIYTDQKGSMEEVQYLYKKKTGKKLSVSRIIREALDDYLAKAREALKQEE